MRSPLTSIAAALNSAAMLLLAAGLFGNWVWGFVGALALHALAQAMGWIELRRDQERRQP